MTTTTQSAETKQLLGHVFRPLTEQDWECFAGADEGSFVSYCADGTALILSPSGVVSEIEPSGYQTDWTPRHLGNEE
jgi:hypothetical protein